MAKNRAEFERSAEAIDQWLDALELEDTNEFDAGELGDSLDDLNLLSCGGAPDSELSDAVTRARRSGCGWAPIALTLGIPRQRARDNFIHGPWQ